MADHQPMRPVDEGLLHEWLDGQLDAATGAQIERWVAEDPAWAAALAEARGLIAASRRITRALDDVPADVIPRDGVLAAGAARAMAEAPMAAAAAPPPEGDTAAVPMTARVAAGRAPAVTPRAHRPRLQWWTWRNAAAIALVAGGSAAVFRVTQQTPELRPPATIAANSPAPVATMPSMVDSVAMGATEMPMTAGGSSSESAIADAAPLAARGPALPLDADVVASSERARAAAPAAPPPPMSQKAEAVVAEAKGVADAAERRTSAPAAAAAPAAAEQARTGAALEPVRIGATRDTAARRVAGAAVSSLAADARRDDSTSRTSRLRPADVALSSVVATSAGANRKEAAPAIGQVVDLASLGTRCLQVRPVGQNDAWFATIDLDVSEVTGGRREARVRLAVDGEERGIETGWRRVGADEVLVAPVPALGPVRLSIATARADGQQPIAVRWRTCTPPQ
ncbi:MAG: hypothetical protein MUE41_06030 [Gemmatimonadaceae bacterium]|nr:hypothetical protein [Gemmatimonadaceae bacterium]